jgi:Tfp pilus assembly protein PilZ
MGEHRRQNVRYSIRFPVQVWHGQRTVSLLTEDVSQGGVFLCTDSPPPLLQLVQVALVLPPFPERDRALKAHGMTVHVVETENAQGRIPGIGIQFYALDTATREAWDAFVKHVAANYPEATDQVPLTLPAGNAPAEATGRAERLAAILDVKPASLDDLEEIYTRDVSTGSLFVPTRLEIPAGSHVGLNIVHPAGGSPYLLEATVLHRTGAGLGVELIGVDEKLRTEFLNFVRGGIVIDDEVVVDGGTPD